MSMITATTWVPRGFAAPFPTRYEFDEAEFERITSLAKLHLEDAQDELADAQQDADEGTATETTKKARSNNSTEEVDDDLKEYDLEHYDEDDAAEGPGVGMAMFGNVKALAYHDANSDDPYITLQEHDEEDEDREELQILATDNLVLAAKVEDEVAHLEVLVYEDEADNLYVHHDVMLPAIPLCVEWLDFPVAREADKDARGSFVAVGTFDPDIEIWDLDIIDCMLPNAILGQGGDAEKSARGEKKKKKKRKKQKANDKYHVDAVLALAANRDHRNLLASSSADKTIKLWDLNTTTCAKSYGYHTDKVCALAWHPTTSTVLLSGSYDRTVVAADMRTPDAKVPRWEVGSDVESVRWDPHDPNLFYIATEGGVLYHHDVRRAPATPASVKPIWTLQAHDESISSFDVNPIIPGFLATGSTDKEVKLWNVQASGPSMVVSRNLGVGKVFATNFAPDQEVGFRLAVAGSKGSVQIWDTSTNAAIRRIFAHRVAPAEGEVSERLVGVQEDTSESDDEDEDADAEDEKQGGGDGAEGWESMDED
ncbi:MAG: hypothetical protein M1838_004843 [Thelocarpon superellum]|nr:MAG: hypothetical protein M1838_004843 [Thelocarpon superellum]